MLGNADTRITIGGIDLTHLLLMAPLAPIYKPDWGEIPSLPMLEATFFNKDNILTPTNDSSILYGQDFISIDVKLYKQEGLVWQGVISDISIDFSVKQATLSCESYLSRQLNKSAKPFYDPANPADILRSLFQLHSVPIDEQSFQTARNILDDIAVLARVNPDALEFIGTLGDVVQLLSVAGVGRCFATLEGTIGFETYSESLPPPVSLEITDEELLQWPPFESRITDSLTGYKVEYIYGVAQDTVADPESEVRTNLFTIDFSGNSAVQILDPIGANYIGSTFVSISKRIYYFLDLYLRKEIVKVVSMASSIRLQSEVLRIDGIFRVEGIDRSDSRWTIIKIRVDGYVAGN